MPHALPYCSLLSSLTRTVWSPLHVHTYGTGSVSPCGLSLCQHFLILSVCCLSLLFFFFREQGLSGVKDRFLQIHSWKSHCSEIVPEWSERFPYKNTYMQCCHCSRAAAATSGLWPCTLNECSWDPKGWFQPKELEGRVLSELDIRTLMVSTLVWLFTLVTNGFAPTLPPLFHMQFTMAWSGLSGWVRIKVKDWNSIQQSCPFPVSLIPVGNCSVFVIEVSVTLEQWLSYSACVNGRFISVDSFSLWVVGPVALSEAVHRGKTVWKSRTVRGSKSGQHPKMPSRAS